MLIEDSAKVAGDPRKDTVWCCSYGLAIDEEHRGAEERVGRSGGASDEKNETQFPSYGFKLLDENDTYDDSDTGRVSQQVPRSVPSAPLSLYKPSTGRYPSYKLDISVPTVNDESISLSSYATVVGCPMSEHDTTIPTVQDVAIEMVRQRIDGGYGDVDGKVSPDEEVLAFDGEGWHAVEVFVGKKYKKVADRTVPVSATLPQDFRIVRRRPADLFDDLCPLPGFPPAYEPGLRYTQERHDEYPLDPAGFLWPEELKLAEWVMLQNEKAFAWTEEERGSFRSDLFDPVKFPTMPHTPWVLKNIPIPHGIHSKVCEII